MPRDLARRLAFNITLLGAALVDPRACLRPKCFFGAGFCYLLLPVDLIPDRLFLVGYLDDATAFLAGSAVAWLAIPRAYVAARQSQALSADHVAARRLLMRMEARMRSRIRMGGDRGRVLLDRWIGMLLCRPLLRLMLGRAPRASERRAFRAGLRQRHLLLPPLLRGLVAVPETCTSLTRAMLSSWLLADPDYRAVLRHGLDSEIEAEDGDRLHVWTGRPVSFLHLEKTAGTSLFAVVRSQFHPLQIDPDPFRASPPHLVTPFASNAIPAIQGRSLVWGHYDLPSLRRLDSDRFVFTMLREPRQRLLSLYYFWRSLHPDLLGAADENIQVRFAHRLGLLAFLRCRDPAIVNFIDNVYARRLTGQYAEAGRDPLQDRQAALGRAMAALRTIEFVGITERAELSVARLGAALGVAGLRPPPRLNRGGDPDRPDFRRVAREPMTADIAAELDRLTDLDRTLYDAALARFETDGQLGNVTCVFLENGSRQDHAMTASSGQTTGNVPVEGIDPGGTHGAPKGDATKTGKSDLGNARPTVESGDQNDKPTRVTGNED